MHKLRSDEGWTGSAYFVVAFNIAENHIAGPLELDNAREECRTLLDEQDRWDFAHIVGPLPVVEAYESDPAPTA